jgi:hypothetical protein
MHVFACFIAISRNRPVNSIGYFTLNNKIDTKVPAVLNETYTLIFLD